MRPYVTLDKCDIETNVVLVVQLITAYIKKKKKKWGKVVILAM